MKAKEYLYQLKEIDDLIKTEQEEVDRLMTMATSITQKIREVDVQTTSENKLENLVVKIVDLRNTINAEIDGYIDLKSNARKIIEKINPLVYQTVLFKYYFQNKTFEKTADEMGMSYQWICELHGRALQEFEKNMCS